MENIFDDCRELFFSQRVTEENYENNDLEQILENIDSFEDSLSDTELSQAIDSFDNYLTSENVQTNSSTENETRFKNPISDEEVTKLGRKR